MKKINLRIGLIMVLIMTSCSMFQKKSSTQMSRVQDNSGVQTENANRDASDRAIALTKGWPENSIAAAKEIIIKYGEPQEVTSDSLIWRNFVPFKRIVVHRNLYSNLFPMLHQNALEHVVDYRAPVKKVEAIWRYNGSIVLNQTQGEMTSFAQNEAMNILALNLADQIMTGKMSASGARVTFGKETMNFMNGNKTAYTQVLNFGGQYQTPDMGSSITNKIRWIGDPAQKPSMRIRQAQEAKK